MVIWLIGKIMTDVMANWLVDYNAICAVCVRNDDQVSNWFVDVVCLVDGWFACCWIVVCLLVWLLVLICSCCFFFFSTRRCVKVCSMVWGGLVDPWCGFEFGCWFDWWVVCYDLILLLLSCNAVMEDCTIYMVIWGKEMVCGRKDGYLW